MAAKTVAVRIKLLLNAGQAKPAPPVGPALGQHGLNLMAFCKEFNARTADMKPDVPVPVRITAYTDKSFDFVIKTPPTSHFLKKAAGLKKGSMKPGESMVGEVNLKQIYEIALIKQKDESMKFLPLESICKSVMGTARSMGLKVVSGASSDAPSKT